MKKGLLAITLALGATTVALAQSPAAPAATAPAAPSAASAVDAVRQAVRADRRGVVEKYMQLTPAEAKKFWPVYDAYAKELEKVVSRQNRAVLDYVNTESSMSDGNAKRLAKEVIAVDHEEIALREKTYRKVAAALPAKKAVRFLQIENKIRTLQRFDLVEQMPLVK